MEASTVVPIYDCYLLLSVSGNINAAARKHRKNFGEHEDTDASAIVLAAQDRPNFGVFFHTHELDHGTIAHEVFHLVILIMDGARIAISAEHDEAHAYLCEWITKWVYAELEKAKLI